MIEKAKPIAIKNFKSINKSNDSKFIPDPYKKVASSMETQFLNFMISKMKNTINKNNPESSAVEYYNGLINKERSNIMAKNNGGLGIQKLILNQIYPPHLRNKASYEYFMKNLQPNANKQKIQKYSPDVEKKQQITKADNIQKDNKNE
ncbi:MAG: hypothetical protein CME68_02340 [Halobacteriovoraceae bacterium]|nr:hypothetical protein [Halobacteriovoraceae bacterium]|tara:strand:- start:663 stop:1106 length:444 start_codon:yes stop_codon:yes gene_type:complete